MIFQYLNCQDLKKIFGFV